MKILNNLIQKVANNLRPVLISSDGEVNVVTATVKVIVPLTGALACFFALSPESWSLSTSIRALMASLWWMALAGLIANATLTVFTFLAVKRAIEDAQRE